MKNQTKQDKSKSKFDQILDEAWNTLKSMRFAIIILIIITVASIFNLFASEFITPVQGSTAEVYQAYYHEYGEPRATLLTFFQMNSPYRSWWFYTLFGFLMVSLIICIIDRTPGTYKKVFKARFKADASSYEKMKSHGKLSGGPDTLSQFISVLKKNGYRVRTKSSGESTLIDGAKYQIAKGGSYFLHFGFIFLVIGGALISRGEYRVQAAGLPGELLSQDETSWGFNVRVDDFQIEYFPLAKGHLVEIDKNKLGRILTENVDGTFDLEVYRPSNEFLKSVDGGRMTNRIDLKIGGSRIDQSNISDYIATLTVIENGVDLFTQKIEVNYPLRHRGYRFYQSSFNDSRTDDQGRWTTVLEVRKDSGSPFVWMGIAFFSIGVILSLYVIPRDISAIVTPQGETMQLLIGGRAARNKSLFVGEFNLLVDQIRQAINSKAV